MRTFQFSMLPVICLSLLLVAATPALAEDDIPAVIEVSAQTDIKVTPDIAVMNAGVVTNAQRADAAMQENRTKMNAVFAALKKAGIADKDIQSTGINIQPQYRYVENKAPVVTGYQASNSVNVTVHDMANIGPVIDSLIAQGVNQMNGPSFDVADKDAALDKARAAAVKKARARAEIYAAAAGVKIARLLKISEQQAVTPPPYPMMRMAMQESAQDASTPVAAGEVGLSVSVFLTYEITPQ